MQDVGESWLMTSLTPSPVLVALVETAGSLPVVLLALPAGALADIVDRRRLLLVMQIWMVVAAGAMGVLALMGQMTIQIVRRMDGDRRLDVNQVGETRKVGKVIPVGK